MPVARSASPVLTVDIQATTTTLQGELDVITDLVTFVEQQQFLAVEGIHRQPPTLEERTRARALRLAAARQQLRGAAGLLGRGLAALQVRAAAVCVGCGVQQLLAAQLCCSMTAYAGMCAASCLACCCRSMQPLPESICLQTTTRRATVLLGCHRRKQQWTTAFWPTSRNCAAGGSCGGTQAPARAQVRV